jgi:hypothetical protein
MTELNAIAVFIIKRDDAVLLVQRIQKDDEASQWVFPADTVNPDNLEQSTKKSLNDLLGITPDTTVITEATHTTSTDAYYIGATIDESFDLSTEILRTKWLTPDDLDDLNVTINDDVKHAIRNKL